MDKPISPFSQRLLRSLHHREFRLYFIAQSVSVIGTWMQNVAQAWLVYRLTGSSLMLGLVSFLSLIPILLGGLFGGVLADRVSRYSIAVGTHRLAMVQAFILGGLALTGWIQVWHIMVLALVLGTTHALGMPARHAFVAEIVPREDLPNAIALHSTAFNAARFLGPALAGWIVLVSSEGLVFILNGISYLIFLLIMRRITPQQSTANTTSLSLHDWMQQGLRYAWNTVNIRAALVMVGLVGLVGTPHAVLMPVIADQVFQGGPGTLGLLLGAAGAGSLVGALALAYRANANGLDRVIGVAGIAAGIALAGFSASHILWLSMATLMLVGFCLTTLVASSNMLIQLLVPDELRGRVISLFSVTFLGASPIGNLIAGALTESIAVTSTVLGYSIICATASLLYLYLTPRLTDQDE